MKYPTQKEIMEESPTFSDLTIELASIWKKLAFKRWRTDENWVKFHKLEMLITSLSEGNFVNEPIITMDTRNFYDPKRKTIHLDTNNPSVISALHELAHHLFGPSELKACRWSIHLFKTCFPTQFEKLDWKGHLLVKK